MRHFKISNSNHKLFNNHNRNHDSKNHNHQPKIIVVANEQRKEPRWIWSRTTARRKSRLVSVHVGHVRKKSCYVSVGSKTARTAKSEPTEARIQDFNNSTIHGFRTKNMLTGQFCSSTAKWEKVYARSRVTYLKKYSKCDTPKPLDTDDHTEIFGLDVRPRPSGKTRPAKKTKSETTGSSGGSASGSISDFVFED
nr:hypothetical protein [Tanacetum cinerariifolium]